MDTILMEWTTVDLVLMGLGCLLAGMGLTALAFVLAGGVACLIY